MELDATDFLPLGIFLKFHDSSQAMEERRLQLGEKEERGLGEMEYEKAISTWQAKLNTADEGSIGDGIIRLLCSF